MDYKNGKIYALRTHKGDEVYIGSTIQTLEERFNQHKCKKSNKITSKSLFERYNDVYIELIELFPCESRRELDRREGEIILGFGDKSVNKRIAGLTPNESAARWRANNPEKKAESAAKYYAENREKQLESAAKYRAENQEKINAKYRERRAKKKAEAEGSGGLSPS
jgi:predicted GIY-YIG superfamily endonuclease